MRKPPRPTGRLAVLLACVLLAPGAGLFAADTITKLEAKLAREKDPANRARLHARLAGLRLDELTDDYRHGRNDQGVARLEKYVAGIEEAARGLETLPARGRRKSKGFRELEISVREGIRQLRDLATGLALGDREPVEAAIGRLEAVHRKLLGELFESLKEKKPKKIP